MPDSPDNADEELIQLRLEQWDNAETRADANRWLAADPRARPLLAGQRAIDLALRARAGNDPQHRLIRDRVLASVKEQSAPKAVRDAILAQVNAEADVRRNWLFVGSLRDALNGYFSSRARSWATTFAIFALLLGLGWLFLQPKPPARSASFARIEAWSGEVQVQSGQTRIGFTNGQLLQSGQQLLVDTNGAASVELSNGARLQIGPNSIIALDPESPSAAGGVFLQQGLIAATISPLNISPPLAIRTPHLRATATAGRIDVEADAERSRVHVIDGEVAAARGPGTTSTNIRAGQMLDAFRGEPANAALVARPFARRISDWPFKSDSPWNTSIGSGALLARITAPQWPPQALSNAVIIRPIFFSEPTDPRRNFISPGEEPRQIRYPDWWQPTGQPGEIVCALFINDGLCCEMTEPVRLGSLDIRVRERNSTDLFGSGVGWSWPRPRTIGGSAFAGLIRRGELTFGIPHALALAVNPKYLNATRGTGGHVWPGVPIAPEVVAQFGREGNLAIGSLLVISPRTNSLDLGFGASGPAYEIARALQDYGAYVIQTTEAPLQIISAADAGLPPDIDAILARLIPHLRLVSNNSLRNVGGGGERSRPGAPPFSE
jgi:hypothetical protein